MTDLLGNTTNEIPRDHYGRPLITPPDGGKPQGYTRTTTISEQLAETRNLEAWKERQIVRGMSQRPDLVDAASTLTESAADRKPLNRIAADCHQHVDSQRKANLGTLLHAATEAADNGQDYDLDPKWKQHVASYKRATEGWTHLHREQMTVNDSHCIAGTPDHISVLPASAYGRKKPRPRIADLKTGDVLDYSIREIACQLAIYANAEWLYDWETNERHPMPDNLDKTTGVVIHIPQGGGGWCRLYEIDLVAGWEAAKHSIWTHKWRKKKVANLASALPYGDPLDEWLRTRILRLSTHPAARPYLADRLTPDFGTLSTGLNLEAADQIVAVLDLIETHCEAPFPERDPRTITTTNRKR